MYHAEHGGFEGVGDNVLRSWMLYSFRIQAGMTTYIGARVCVYALIFAGR